MDSKKQQEINVALLSCLVKSHKASMLIAKVMVAVGNEKIEKMKEYEAENNRFMEALDGCFKLIEDGENDL